MEIKLNDYEIREALAEAISKKLNYLIIDIEPSDCWFEYEAIGTEVQIDEICSIKFCYKTHE